MRSEAWDNVERKLRCLRAIGRTDLESARRLVLANIVETYIRLRPAEQELFAAEIERESNKEVQNMVINWEDALAASKNEGLEQGILQGKASVLKRQLARRQGELPDWVDERLEQASREELESWADRVLDAERLEDFFASR